MRHYCGVIAALYVFTYFLAVVVAGWAVEVVEAGVEAVESVAGAGWAAGVGAEAEAAGEPSASEDLAAAGEPEESWACVLVGVVARAASRVGVPFQSFQAPYQ